MLFATRCEGSLNLRLVAYVGLRVACRSAYYAHPRTASTQRLRERKSDSARTAGYQRMLSGKRSIRHV